MPVLNNVIVVYEDRVHWVEAAIDRGFSRAGAEAASFWLLGAQEIERTVRDLQEALPNSELRLLSIDQFLAELPNLALHERQDCLLWNITDGQAGFRGSHLTSFAAMTGTPYFGCPPYAQALGQDKFKMYSLCRQLGIRTPDSLLIENGDVIAGWGDVVEGTSCFVKPNSGGNKVGITDASRSATFSEAVRSSRVTGAQLQDRMIVQQFIEGPEVRLTFIDAGINDGALPLGFDLVEEHGDSFITADERDSKYEEFRDFLGWNGMEPALRSFAVQGMADAVLKISKHVRLKDYFTFDFRLDGAGRAYLIDFNPGAFLYGNDVEGYTRAVFNLSLPNAILTAMRRCQTGIGHQALQVHGQAFRL